VSGAHSPAIAPGYHVGREPGNKGRRYPPEILSPGEVRALLRGCSNRAPTGVRNRALLVVLYRAGLRLDEALSLMPRDVDAQRGTVNVRHGKGDKHRIVGMDPEAFAVLDRWVELRRRRRIGSPHRPIFCTLAGDELDPSYVRRLLHRLAAKAQITKRVHPHGLRHTHAAELAAEGTPASVIRDQLGHARLSTTDRYLRHVAPQERVDRMRARAWEP
jgi:site-specific recombinase XerD